MTIIILQPTVSIPIPQLGKELEDAVENLQASPTSQSFQTHEKIYSLLDCRRSNPITPEQFPILVVDIVRISNEIMLGLS